MLWFVFCQGFADKGLADAVVFHPFASRLLERFASRVALGDLEECLSGAERRGVVSRRIPLLKQIRSFFRDGVARVAADR